MRVDGLRPHLAAVVNRALGLLGLVALGVSISAFAEDPGTERVEWRKVPIEVFLQVGTERQVQFPSPVKVGIPGSIQAHLRTQSIGDTVYFRPSGAFPATRAVVQTLDGERTYLLDLSASETGSPTAPLKVVDPNLDDANSNPDESAGTAAIRQSLDPVALTRFAAQQLYAPARLLKGSPDVVRVPVRDEPVDLMRGATLTAVPVIAWRSGGLHITAVKLTNAGTTPFVLDPRSLKGEWLTAAFQHNRLFAAGDEADTTVVYLVSRRPFAEARP